MAHNEDISSLNNYQHYDDLKINLNCSESDVFEIVKRIHPNWSEDNVVIKRLQGTGGFMNKTYACFHSDDVDSQNNGMFIRINDPGVEGIFIDRKSEIRYCSFLHFMHLEPEAFSRHL